MSHGRDFRVQGFRSRRSVRDVLQWVDSETAISSESDVIGLVDCGGRVLADDVFAPISVPEFHRSAMDGYALIGAETAGASDDNPLPFRLIGDAFPARAFPGRVVPGTAIRIMTGAPLPDGADAVLPVEVTQELPAGTDSAAWMQALGPVSPGKNVSARGEDITVGSLLLPNQRRLRPQDAAVLASVGIARVPVIRRPSIAILTTGNELVRPGEMRQPYQVFDANSTLLQCLVSRDGGEIVESCSVRDDCDALRNKLMASQVDVILISGGSSVGAEDFVPGLINELGSLPIHGIAMRPASPAGIGRIGRSLVFLLPGHPVSCLCAYDFFAGRAVRRLGGRTPDWPYPVKTGKVARTMTSVVGRLDYMRVQFQDGLVESMAMSGASVLSSTVRADGFVIVPESVDEYPAGTEVDVYLYDAI
jgi:molybdopterin molybdotransferase